MEARQAPNYVQIPFQGQVSRTEVKETPGTVLAATPTQHKVLPLALPQPLKKKKTKLHTKAIVLVHNHLT